MAQGRLGGRSVGRPVPHPAAPHFWIDGYLTLRALLTRDPTKVPASKLILILLRNLRVSKDLLESFRPLSFDLDRDPDNTPVDRKLRATRRRRDAVVMATKDVWLELSAPIVGIIHGLSVHAEANMHTLTAVTSAGPWRMDNEVE